ncbi:MAG: four helix bundle protein [Chitinophagaceae bacterium]|nr:four helix bundle protein [Chitinophagaceae bacterium]
MSKVTDCDMENAETSGWLDFALACNYIDSSQHGRMIMKTEETGRLLHHMISNPDKY